MITSPTLPRCSRRATKLVTSELRNIRPSARRSSPGIRRLGIDGLDSRALADPVAEIHGHPLALLEAMRDSRFLPVVVVERHGVELHLVVASHQRHERALAAQDQRRRRNLHVARHREVQDGVDEAARDDLAVGVVEIDLDQHHSRPRVELVRDPGHLAREDLVRPLGQLHVRLVADLDEGGVALVDVTVDAQRVDLRHGDDRERPRLRVGGVLQERAGIGKAGGDGPVERRPQKLVALDRLEGLLGGARDLGVGDRDVPILGGNDSRGHQDLGPLRDDLLVLGVGLRGDRLGIHLGGFDARQHLPALHRVALVHPDFPQIAGHLGVERHLGVSVRLGLDRESSGRGGALGGHDQDLWSGGLHLAALVDFLAGLGRSAAEQHGDAAYQQHQQGHSSQIQKNRALRSTHVALSGEGVWPPSPCCVPAEEFPSPPAHSSPRSSARKRDSRRCFSGRLTRKSE